MSEPRRMWLLVATALTSVWLLGRTPPGPPATTDTAMRLLSSGAEAGFERALGPRRFEFPRDHAAHPGYRSEWWYFTGRLGNADGRRFGFQLTLFRHALAPHQSRSSSDWRTSNVLLGHFALSDIDKQQFHAHERLARNHPLLASFSPLSPRVTLDEWRIERLLGEDERWRLAAGQGDIAIDLSLTARTPIVLQGDRGWSAKSATPGNASYYYSIPRLAVQGELRLESHRHEVEGEAWLDREWSTSALERTQQGWDWFALHFDNGANLMFYRLRGESGDTAALSSGTYISPDGQVQPLTAADVTLAVSRRWTSPDSGRIYPLDWRLEVERLGIELEIKPAFDAQEWRGRFRYWEGAVLATGTHGASGYIELTGY